MVGLIDDDNDAVWEDVVGMLDLFLAGEFLLGHFCWGVLLDGGLGCFLRLLLKSETSQNPMPLQIVLSFLYNRVLYEHYNKLRGWETDNLASLGIPFLSIIA